MKTSSQELRTPGIAKGKVTFEKVFHLLPLRSREASSSVESIACRTPALGRKAIGNMPIVCTAVRPPSPYMVKSFSPSICFVISPLLPKSKISDKDRENGGEITGRSPIVLRNFFPLMAVLFMTKAKMNPMIVENVAVRMPSLTLPHSALRYCLEERIVTQVRIENLPSARKVNLMASNRG